ncbi:hypothetical protein CWI39_3352p0010, partial [Hamiltosporidium magnivora]
NIDSNIDSNNYIDSNRNIDSNNTNNNYSNSNTNTNNTNQTINNTNPNNNNIIFKVELSYTDIDKYIALDISNNVIDIYILLRVLPRIYISSNSYVGNPNTGNLYTGNTGNLYTGNPYTGNTNNNLYTSNPYTNYTNNNNTNNYTNNNNNNYTNNKFTTLHKKLQLFDTLDWRRVSIKEVPFIKERYDIKIQIDCYNKENKNIINKIIEEKRKIPFNTQESEFIFYTLCYYSSSVYFSKVIDTGRGSIYRNMLDGNVLDGNNGRGSIYSNIDSNILEGNSNSGSGSIYRNSSIDSNRNIDSNILDSNRNSNRNIDSNRNSNIDNNIRDNKDNTRDINTNHTNTNHTNTTNHTNHTNHTNQYNHNTNHTNQYNHNTNQYNNNTKKLTCSEIRVILKDISFDNYYYLECLLSRKERFISLQLE